MTETNRKTVPSEIEGGEISSADVVAFLQRNRELAGLMAVMLTIVLAAVAVTLALLVSGREEPVAVDLDEGGLSGEEEPISTDLDEAGLSGGEEPVSMDFDEAGFYAPEQDEQVGTWRWMRREGRIFLNNPSDESRSALVQMTLKTNTAEGATVAASYPDGTEEELTMGPDARVDLRRELSLDPGANVMTLTTDAPLTPPDPSDSRDELALSVSNTNIEVSGGEEPISTDLDETGSSGEEEPLSKDFDDAGFYAPEQDERVGTWRWMRREGRIFLNNPSDESRSALVQMTLKTNTVEGATVTASYPDGTEEELTMGRDGRVELRREVSLEPGANVMTLTTDAPLTPPAPGDSRDELALSVSNAAIEDQATPPLR